MGFRVQGVAYMELPKIIIGSEYSSDSVYLREL